eukprot:355834_1
MGSETSKCPRDKNYDHSFKVKNQQLHQKSTTTSKIGIAIHAKCHRDKNYDHNFKIIVPYTKTYTISAILNDIEKRINTKYHPIKFQICTIEPQSFLRTEMSNTQQILYHLGAYDLDAPITSYALKWIQWKGLHLLIDMKQHIEVPICVKCPRNHEYDNNFEITVPYHTENANQYRICTFLSDVHEYINDQYSPIKFHITHISAESFLGMDMGPNECDWNDKITSYSQVDICSKGISLEIDIDIYEHNITSLVPMCPEMQNLNEICPVYVRMRYQDTFNQENLDHLIEYEHPDESSCKYGDQCYAFKRLEAGGNDLNDLCHITIYRHPPRSGRMISISEQKDEINSFCFNDTWSANCALWRPEYFEEDGYLKLLMNEVIKNGYKSDLCLYCRDNDECNHKEYTLMEIVEKKLNCTRHQLMGSPLNKAEMLSILLYTGGQSNYDLSKCQRNGNYRKWKWLDLCLFNAIIKLSKREHGRYKIYTGLGSTKLKNRYVKCGYFKTYVSTSWIKQVAEVFVENDGMLFEIQDSFRENAICCDVSWISKFGLNECEILIARSIDAVLNSFQCKVIDTKNETQIVSLQLYGEHEKHTKRLQQMMNEASKVDVNLLVQYAEEILECNEQDIQITNTQKKKKKRYFVQINIGNQYLNGSQNLCLISIWR